MTDEQVVKALEYCKEQDITSECSECNIKEKVCRREMIAIALDLIKRQQAEIENLKADKEVLSSKRANIFEISNAFERGQKSGIEKFFDVLTKKYSQADILCPRRIISLTVREAEELVKELTEVSNGK